MRFHLPLNPLTLMSVCAAGLILPSNADQFGLFTFVDHGTYIEITDYPLLATGHVVIPSEISGKPVTSIGKDAFYLCRLITGVTIPNTVTSLGNSAFYACESLLEVNLPDGVSSIGTSAFSGCKSLTSATLPSGMTRIPATMFQYCSLLTAISIPNTVTSIGDSAFLGCSNLATIELPSGLTSISYGMLAGCSKLTAIQIPAGVVSIGSGAFGSCSELQEIEIPSGVESIGSGAFGSCRKLRELAFPAGVKVIENSMFRFCDALETVTLPPAITSVGELSFSSCPKLRDVALPATLTSIGNHAFEYSGLTSVNIPAAVTSIGGRAFRSCDALVSITVAPANPNFSSFNGMLLNKVQTQLFACPGKFPGHCVIPSTVTEIWNYAFFGCSLLTGVTLPPGLSQIRDDVFGNCSVLASVTIPAGVTTIGQWSFQGCSSLASVTIPSTVTSIGHSAFSKCHALSEVTIPESVTAISLSFSDCGSLAAIHVNPANANFSSLDGVLFDKQQKKLFAFPGGRGGNFIIPPTVTWIHDNAFFNCRNLTGIFIPPGVAYLGSYAFSGCGKLESLTIPASVATYGDFSFGNCGKLRSAIFLGSSPGGFSPFYNPPPGFKIYYFNGAPSFTSPTWTVAWETYDTVNMGAYSPEKPWLVAHGFNHDTPLESDPNQDGVSLLTAYGLNLDPNLNLASSMPQPVVANGALSIRFYAGNPDVSYSVKASSNLSDWTSDGVVLSPPDADQWRTATVEASANQKFLRLAIEE